MHPARQITEVLGAQARLAAGVAGAGGVRLGDEVVAGIPALMAHPARGSAWPSLVFVNGVTREGRRHPEVRRAAEQLAGTGFLVLVPDLPGLAVGALGDATVEGLVGVVRAGIHLPACRGARMGLLGVSAGTTLALLAAEDERVAERITVVAGLAPFGDLEGIVRLATTGSYLDDGRLASYPAGPFLTLVIARSLALGVAGKGGKALRKLLAAVDDDDPNPLATLRAVDPAGLGGKAAALRALLVNADPARFDELYAALPAAIRDGVRRLSPLAGVGRLRAPAELASAPRDKYFPLAESEALAAASPLVRLTVSPALGHHRPQSPLTGAAELVRINAFAVRALRAARRC